MVLQRNENKIERRVSEAPQQTQGVSPAPETSLDHALKLLQPWLEDRELTELCLYRPQEAFIERARAWTRVALPFANFGSS